jgi:hypothetical protein
MFIGFDAATGKTLWERYSTATEAGDNKDLEGGFPDFPRLIIENRPIRDVTSGEDDWHDYMKAIGVSRKLVAAIIDPDFEDIRYIASYKY